MAEGSASNNVIPFAQEWEPAGRDRKAARILANMSSAVRVRVAALAVEPITVGPMDDAHVVTDWLEEAFGLQVLASCGVAICHERSDGREVYRLTALGWAVYNLVAKEPVAI